MRALAKFTSGVLRVESPPISRVRLFRSPNRNEPLVYVTIRFAFNSIRVVADGGRTVRLELKTSVNPQIATASTQSGVSSDPSFSSISSIELQHDKNVKSVTVAIHNFDVMRSLPDSAIPSLKSGYPIQYNYLQSVPATQEIASAPAKPQSDRDYLLSKLQAGIDPATLREPFPVLDPAKSSSNAMSKLLPSYYTRPVASQSDYRRMKIYSAYQIFEQEVEMTLREFLSSSVYEFSYLDRTGTPIEYVEVNVRPSLIISEMEKLALSDPSGKITDNNVFNSSIVSDVSFVRDIISVGSLTSTEFTGEDNQSRSKKPKIKRTHYFSEGLGRLSIPFKSEVYGLPSKRSKVSGQSNSSKPSIVPFYVTNDAINSVVIIKKLPPGSISVAVMVRNMTKGERTFVELARTRIANENNVRVPITFPETDCTYETKIISYDRKQRKKESCNVVVYENRTQYSNASLRVSPPALIGDQKVKFKITADFTDSGRQDLTNLINSINASGVSPTILSADGYVSDPNLYSEVFSCKIERIDLETGEQSYTKEISIGSTGFDFIDKVSSSAGAVYVFSLGIKSPSSLIPSQPLYKFGTFGGRYLQSLPSDAALTRDSKSGADFSIIDSGIKRVIEVPTTRLRGSVSQIFLTKTMRDSNLIEWLYDGDLTEVDHFQVFGSADGVECLLGCSFRVTAFEDRELYERVGVVKYRVRPVYLDLTPGDSFEISTYRPKTLPSILEVNFVNGQAWRDPVVAVNSQVVVDTAESADSAYEDYYRVDIERKESSPRESKKKKLETSSGLSSIVVVPRSPPIEAFNPAPMPESSIIIRPVTPFTAATIAEAQIVGNQTTSTQALTEQASLQLSSQTIDAQPTSYHRVLR